MKIYTKKGDEGKTSLLGGTRVPKHHLRIEAYGTLDELNSWLGLLKDHQMPVSYRDQIKFIQDTLFSLGSLLAADPENNRMKLPVVGYDAVEQLEQSIDSMDSSLAPLQNFVLPGGHPANSTAHVARCVCRRAERLVVQLHETSPQPAVVLQYLNRLSDWLFTFAREMSRLAGAEEVPWTPRG